MTPMYSWRETAGACKNDGGISAVDCAPAGLDTVASRADVEAMSDLIALTDIASCEDNVA